MKPIPASGCPCLPGGSFLFTRSLRVSGWWKQTLHIIPEGGYPVDVVETDLDGLRYGPDPASVCCAECGRRWAMPAATEE